MPTSAHDLATIVRALAETNNELVRAAAEADPERITEVMARTTALEKQRDRLLRATAAVSAGRYETAVPLRDQVIRALRLGGHPMSTRLLADISRARYGDVVDTTKLSSLRRDEASSWRAAHLGGHANARDVYVVPALAHDRFAPVRGALALSSWPLVDRIIAPASPRVDMLRVTLALADECAHAPASASWLPGLTRLLTRLARTVPGVPGVPASADDIDVVRAAVRHELAALEADDTREREIAVSRARNALDEYTLLFGAAMTVHRAASARGA